MVVEQGAPANGEAGAQGELAPTYIDQLITDETPAGDPLPDLLSAADSLVVPVGPAGGPLQGSTMAGALPDPEGDGPGTGPEPAPAPTITGLLPAEVPAGAPDMGLTVQGTGFVDGAVAIFNGADMATNFGSDTTVNFICPTSTLAEGTATVSVRNPDGGVSTDATLNVIPPVEFDDEPQSRRKRRA